MKKKILLLLLGHSFFTNAQSVIQTINSGGLSTSSISVGEIIITPTSPSQSHSGIIGILAQSNQQTLEVKELELGKNLKVYPNPTTSKIYFSNSEIISDSEVKIYTTSGELIAQKKINSDMSINLESLPSGIYLLEFTNKKIKSFKIIKH